MSGNKSNNKKIILLELDYTLPKNRLFTETSEAERQSIYSLLGEVKNPKYKTLLNIVGILEECYIAPTIYPNGQEQCHYGADRSISDLMRLLWGKDIKIHPAELMKILYDFYWEGLIGGGFCGDIKKYVFNCIEIGNLVAVLNKTVSDDYNLKRDRKSSSYDWIYYTFPIEGTTGIPFVEWGTLTKENTEVKFIGQERQIALM